MAITIRVDFRIKYDSFPENITFFFFCRLYVLLVHLFVKLECVKFYLVSLHLGARGQLRLINVILPGYFF